MDVLGINGSPNREGNSWFLLNECLNSAKENGVGTEILQLADYELAECDRCLKCLKEKKCHFDDDFRKIGEKMLGARVIIMATPTYAAGISPLLKNLFDRMYPFRLDGFKLRDKYASFICVGGFVHGFQEVALQQLMANALYQGMVVVGNTLGEDTLKPHAQGPFVIGSQQRDDGLMHFVKKDAAAVRGAGELGKRIASLLKES